MCGRTILANPHDIAEWFDVDAPADLPPRYNIAPSQLIAIVRTPRKLEMLRWGIPRAEKRPPQINMRVEQILKSANTQRRCLVVVDGFYEWQKTGPAASARQPYLLKDAEGHPLGMGGVWNKTTTVDGEVIESVAILTCPPRPPVAAIHDRMPLIIPRGAYRRWIDMGADVTDLLQPTSTTLVAIPVSTYVNSPKNDDPKCIEATEPRGPAQGALF
jgi:putative SOS response-associated peptidase YedK